MRVHSGAVWSDFLGLNQDHSLTTALNRIREYGCGVLLYIQRDDSCLETALNGCNTPDDEAINRVAPDTKLYGTGAQCLRALGISNMRLLTQSPKKLAALDGFGLKILDTLPLAES